MAKDTIDADVVHCHTWYTDMAGLLASKLWGVPYVLSIHSLEPLRPWKVEQLGNAYHLSSWMERTALEQADAVIAVSAETRDDVLRLFEVDAAKVHVIHNGIDLAEYRPSGAKDALQRHGIDPNRPYLLFVGRITRQKGIIHLVDAIPAIDPSLQIVLCAGAPDTPEIGREMAARVAEISAAAPRCDLDPRDVAAGRRDPALRACGGVLLSVRLRAVRHHQPRGHGLRDRGGGLQDRRHSRGGGSRGDGSAGRAGTQTRDVRARRSRPPSPPASPRRSTASPPIRRCARGWVDRAASGRSTISAGMRSQTPHWPSTVACDESLLPDGGREPLVSAARKQLGRLARLYGIERSYTDLWQRRHVATAATERALLAAMGVPAASADEVERSLALADEAAWCTPLPPVIVTRQPGPCATLTLPETTRGAIAWSVATEAGEAVHGEVDAKRARGRGQRHLRRRRPFGATGCRCPICRSVTTGSCWRLGHPPARA